MTTKIFIYLFIFSFLLSNNSIGQIPSVVWSKSFGSSLIDEGMSIIQTADNGYLIGGRTNREDGDVSGYHPGACSLTACFDIWIIKIDKNGILEWQKCLGGTDEDLSFSISLTAEGGFIMCGFTDSNDGDVNGNHGNTDIWVVKLDSVGNIQWQKCYGGTMQDYGSSISQTSDGGFIISAGTYSNDGDISGNHGGSDASIIKIDSNGIIEWQKCYGGTQDDWGKVICIPDNKYLIYCEAYSNDGDITFNHGQQDIWVAKLDSAGGIIWEQSYGGPASDHIWINGGAFITSDNGFIIGGSTYSNSGDVSGNHGLQDYWAFKIDSMGNLLWQRPSGGTSSDWFPGMGSTSNGGCVMAGHSESIDGDVIGSHGNVDGWVVKLDSTGGFQWQKCLGGTDGDLLLSVIEDDILEVVTTGGSWSFDGDLLGEGNKGELDLWVVKLAFYSLDAALAKIVYPEENIPVCDNSFSPEIIIKNNAPIPIVSLDINFQIDNGSVQSTSWSGNLLRDSIEQMTLPAVSASGGLHSLKIFITNPNGVTDENAINDTLVTSFTIDTSYAPVPFFEGFENPVFPPADWELYDYLNMVTHFPSAGGFGNSDSCIRVRLFGSSDFADLTIPEIGFSNLVSPATLSFSLASAMRNSSSIQSLGIYISTDCEFTWNLIYYKEDSALSTTGYRLGNWTPLPNEWRMESVDLTSFIGMPHIRLGYEIFGANSNNLYIDDINIADANSGVQQSLHPDQEWHCQFNSSSQILTVNIISDFTQNFQIQLLDLTGRILLQMPINVNAGFNKKEIRAENLNKGMFLVSLISESRIETKKVIKN